MVRPVEPTVRSLARLSSDTEGEGLHTRITPVSGSPLLLAVLPLETNDTYNPKEVLERTCREWRLATSIAKIRSPVSMLALALRSLKVIQPLDHVPDVAQVAASTLAQTVTREPKRKDSERAR